MNGPPQSFAQKFIMLDLPDSWRSRLSSELEQPYWKNLEKFVASERNQRDVFPPPNEVAQAFELTPWEQVRVLILGQDPYHDHHQAHGLAFSVKEDVSIPPSLKNIFKELVADIGCSLPSTGDLSPWAKQGVLLLNTVLTVGAHQANSHRKQGWEKFTDAVINLISRDHEHVVFVLWGKPAQSKINLIDAHRHTILEAPHPSPLSAYRGFFSSRPFSKINQALQKHGQPQVDWKLD